MTTADQRLQRDTAYRVVALAMNGHKLDLTVDEWKEHARHIVGDRRKSLTATQRKIQRYANNLLLSIPKEKNQ